MQGGHIDFETYSELDVREVGAWRYAEDPSTEILCMAWAIGDDEPALWLPDDPFPQPLAELIASEGALHAHYADFELAVWELVGIRRYQFPVVLPTQWHDTAAWCAAAALPRQLDRAAAAADIPQRKDAEGHRVMQQLSKPRKVPRQNKWRRMTKEQYPDKYEALYKYNLQDVVVEQALAAKVKPISEAERKVYLEDSRINARGIPLDLEAAAAAQRMAEEYQITLIDECEKLTDGIRPSQTAKLAEWLGTDDVQKETMEYVAREWRARWPRKARVAELRLETSKASTKKLVRMLEVASPYDERARNTIMYHAAHTGRWAGKLIQPHNFPRGGLKPWEQDLFFDILLKHGLPGVLLFWDKPMDILSQCMRGFIRATLGKILYVGDYAAIEIRLLCWFAGQNDILKLFQQGIDVYVEMAAVIYGKPERLITEEERWLGKNTVLGCGYQMWADTFQAQALNKGGVDIGYDLSLTSVKAFRNRFDKVPPFWKAVESAAIQALRRPHTTVTLALANTKLRFRADDDALYIKLPSNRVLTYPGAYLVSGERHGKTQVQIEYMAERKTQWVSISTYGGKLVENIIQAAARDVMAHGMTNVEQAGYPVITTVHDEVVSETEEDHGSQEDYISRLCDAPAWCRQGQVHAPIDAEGFQCIRYRKG